MIYFDYRAQQANLQKSRKRRLIKRQVYSNDNTYTGTEDVDIDTYSTTGTDIGDEEFFDCSDDELDIENGLVNTFLLALFVPLLDFELLCVFRLRSYLSFNLKLMLHV